jgi:hypothetical protein
MSSKLTLIGMVAAVWSFSCATAAWAAGPKYDALLHSDRFVQAYDKKYSGLRGLTSDTLLIDLSETLDDYLASGNHASSVASDYKVRQVERNLFSSLRANLCSSDAKRIDSGRLKAVVTRELVKVFEQERSEITDSEFGRLSATVVRFIEATALPNFCKW